MLAARLLSLIAVVFLLLPSRATPQNHHLEFIGQADFPTGFTFQGSEVGGLSAIRYDSRNDIYLALSDDFSNVAAARLYKLKIDLSDGRLSAPDVSFVDCIFLLDQKGRTFSRGTLDPEGLALTHDGTFYVSSEGGSRFKYWPFIRQFSSTGTSLRDLPVPAKFTPAADGKYGVRHGEVYEALTLTPNGKFLFTGTENALVQDGPRADLGQSSPSRILKYDLPSGKPVAEYLYFVEPVAQRPFPPDGYRDNGLVELIALDDVSLLALERSYIQGVGNKINIFEVSLQNADNIRDIERLDGVDISKVKAASKTLLFDLAELGIRLDNLEGMTFGPGLVDGRSSLILVSDNNFSEVQFTQFLAFAVTDRPQKIVRPLIHEIQGAGHRSPLLAREVENVTGIVTVISTQNNRPGFWLQGENEDGDVATSEGVFVSPANGQFQVSVGDKVLVAGRVAERGRQRQLTVTQLEDAQISVLSGGNVLPAPVVIGVQGRKPPNEVIDDDGLEQFQPSTDGIDFYESLEGMRVAVLSPVVVGPASRFGDLVVLGDDGVAASVRSARGGIVVRQNDFNPERLVVQVGSDAEVAVNVGDRFSGRIVGVLDYAFGNFRLIPTDPLAEIMSAGLAPETTSLRKDQSHLLIASYNLENLDARDGDNKFDRVARSIVENLAAPDILGLQEVQDDNGPEKDDVVAADKTLGRLVAAIVAAGGPDYDFVQIDPVSNADGGQPGGNIRVGFLFDPARVTFTRRGQAGALDENTVALDSTGMHLTLNPGRIYPREKCFVRSRKPLAAEFDFNGQRLFVVNNHLNSKGGDDRLFGAIQPPELPSEISRKQQALAVQAFVHEIMHRDPHANVIVLGDMNELEFRAPLHLIAGPYLTNLMTTLPVTDRYSYVFTGNSQLLDHILVSGDLLKMAAPEIDIVHFNAEFSRSRRASDHDAVVARFSFKE